MSLKVRLPIVAQVVIVALLTTSFELAADRLAFRSPLNALWMIGLPVLLGVILNSGPGRKVAMATTLVIVSLLTGMFVGVFFTSYT